MHTEQYLHRGCLFDLMCESTKSASRSSLKQAFSYQNGKVLDQNYKNFVFLSWLSSKSTSFAQLVSFSAKKSISFNVFAHKGHNKNDETVP